jgi:uncharacterized protein DUF3147
MKVTAEFSRLRQTGWPEYALRFVFGGVVTVITGWIAQRFGPVIGGLFLSFPAIFPASVTSNGTSNGAKHYTVWQEKREEEVLLVWLLPAPRWEA